MWDDVGSRTGWLSVTLRLYPPLRDRSNFDPSKIRFLCSSLFTCPTSPLWFIISPWTRHFLYFPEIKEWSLTVLHDSRKSVPAVADRLYPLYKLGKGVFWRGKNRPIASIRRFPLRAQSWKFWLRPPTVYFMMLPSSYFTEAHVIHTPYFPSKRGPTPKKFSHQYVLQLCIIIFPTVDNSSNRRSLMCFTS